MERVNQEIKQRVDQREKELEEMVERYQRLEK